MNIILAKSAGFCFGVKRATGVAFDAAETHDQICSLGPIIHSPQVVSKLAEKGVEVVERVEDIPGGAVIIRSHGIAANEFEAIRSRRIEIVDATCPFVQKAQDYAAQLRDEGYVVVVVGEAQHPEVRGIVSFAAEGEVFVVADRAEATALPFRGRMGLIAQTTQSMENLREVVGICLEKCKEMRVFNTICNATSERQNEARIISRKADLILVIGGFNSANTSRLAQICAEIQPRTHHVETADQIESSWFEGVETVGITAGASTPGWIIDEVLEKVAAFGK